MLGEPRSLSGDPDSCRSATPRNLPWYPGESEIREREQVLSENERAFQVDLRGVVDLLSRHIYSSPRVYLRELLQNGKDAITARRELENAGGTIRITPLSDSSPEFVLRDDGVGLTMQEMSDLLATVGRSSKRDLFDLPRQDYLGQFGIGLLSCFMVADEIVIRSRSAKGAASVVWTGRSDGTFTVSETDEEYPVGTSVHLRPRPDQVALLQTKAVLSLAETYGEFLPVNVQVDLAGGGEETITHDAPFINPRSNPEAAAAYGEALLGTQPFAMIPLDVPGTGTRGAAYVLPFAPPPGSRQSHRVYLSDMLLAERVDDLLPEWAFFVRAVVNSTALAPTASREQLVDNEALHLTRDELGAALRRWILDLGLTAPHMAEQFVSIHELSLKSMLRHDEELAGFITRWLTVETNRGRMSIDTLVTRSIHIRFASSVDDFRQLVAIAGSNDILVNAGYLYDADLVQLLPQLYPEVSVEAVDVLTHFNELDPPPLDDREATVSVENRASDALSSVGCGVVVRSLPSDEIPALYVANADVLRHMDRGRTRGTASPLWGSVLDTIDEALAERAQRGDNLAAKLCLNWQSPLVRELARVADDAAFARTVQLLYTQSLLASQHPLTPADRELMNTALTALVQVSARIPGPSDD